MSDRPDHSKGWDGRESRGPRSSLPCRYGAGVQLLFVTSMRFHGAFSPPWIGISAQRSRWIWDARVPPVSIDAVLSTTWKWIQGTHGSPASSQRCSGRLPSSHRVGQNDDDVGELPVNPRIAAEFVADAYISVLIIKQFCICTCQPVNLKKSAKFRNQFPPFEKLALNRRIWFLPWSLNFHFTPVFHVHLVGNLME